MKWKTVTLLVLAALPGILATAWLALPLLVNTATTPVPLETLQLATVLQSTFLVLVAALAGAAAAPAVGLSAPAISALASGRGVIAALKPQMVPGLVGGLIGATVIIVFHAFAPDILRAAQPEKPLPLAVRVLYGGITEEILIRWGLMSAIAWAGWRLVRKDSRKPSEAVMWTAVVVSALVFGVSHLPSVVQAMPAVPGAVVAYVTIGNATFGVVAGYLFWRYGLEAAIAAHVVAHGVAFIIRG